MQIILEIIHNIAIDKILTKIVPKSITLTEKIFLGLLM